MDEEPESDVFNGTERPLSTSFPPSRRGKLESPADGLSAAGSSESKKMRETCVLLLPKYLSISSDFVLLVRPFLIRVAFWWLLSLSLYGCLSLSSFCSAWDIVLHQYNRALVISLFPVAVFFLWRSLSVTDTRRRACSVWSFTGASGRIWTIRVDALLLHNTLTLLPLRLVALSRGPSCGPFLRLWPIPSWLTQSHDWEFISSMKYWTLSVHQPHYETVHKSKKSA